LSKRKKENSLTLLSHARIRWGGGNERDIARKKKGEKKRFATEGKEKKETSSIKKRQKRREKLNTQEK